MATTSLGNDVPRWLRVYLGLEQAATELRAHLPYVLFGLFQLPAYAAAVARSVGVTPKDDEYVEQTVQRRKARQERLHAGRVSVTVVQSEFALRLRLGSNADMAAQLAHLAELCDLPNVTVQVMPFDVGQYEALRIGNFTIVSTPDRDVPAVQLQGHAGGQLVETSEETAHFVAAFDQARRLALNPRKSQLFIRRLAGEWKERDE